MNRSLVKYQRRSPAISGVSLLVGAAIIGLIIWLFLKRNQVKQVAEYRNEETWDVNYNVDGLPTRIVIHRQAKQQ